jgi:intracellular multiplication protein IcmG
MAENDDSNQFDDEYQFSDIDEGGVTFDEPIAEKKQTYIASDNKYASSNIKRTVLILIGIVIVALVLYKFMGSFFSGTVEKKPTPTPTTSQQTVKKIPDTKLTPIVEKPIQKPVIQQPQISLSNANNQLSQRLSALELVSKNARSQLTNVSGNIESLKTNVSELSSQISQLNNTLSSISQQISEQQQELEKLKPKRKPRKRRAYRTPRIKITYSIQAIIPGRAWLIGSNGTTITVSEGTKIAGYGTVKLIDPHQGKVILKSGRTIEFNANDS